MPSVVDIRGPSGAGKTHLVRLLMASYAHPPEPVFIQGRKRPLGYILQPVSDTMPLVYVVGSYGEAACGGCDTINSQDLICDTIRQAFSRGYDVVYEGLMVSSVWARWADLAREVERQGGRHTFAFLDTPLQTCMSRVDSRRDAAGSPPLADHHNTKAKWETVRRIRDRALAGHFRVVDLDWRNPLPKLLEAIRES